MISTDDVKSAFPHASRYDETAIQTWVDVANVTIHVERVKDPRTLAIVQIAFVMHQLEKPPLNLKARHVLARISRPGRAAAGVKAPHPWAGTPHGARLISAVKF
jgi:hypothetical protein